MNFKSTLRWALLYRGAVWVAALVPVGVALGALYFVGPPRLPRNVGAVRSAATTVYFLAPVAVSLLVFQFVKTAVFYKTVTEATDEQMAERFDSEKVKSEVLEVLDDRLAEMQTELERTRKEVEEIDGGGGPTTQAPASGTASDSGSFDFEG
jgi:hypothetical protein